MGKSYQQLIGDVLFWHSLRYDANGNPREVMPILMTIEAVRSSKSRSRRVMFMRKDVAIALRDREFSANRERHNRVFSFARIGEIVGRHHSTIIHYMRPKKRPEMKPRFEFPIRENSHVEHLSI